MPDLVDTTALQLAVQQLAAAVQRIATQAGDVPAVRRLRNDVERIELDATDCTQLQTLPSDRQGPTDPVARQLETISDTPYDESLWKGVDDEGVGGFHAPRRPPHVPRTRHDHR